MHDTMPSGTVTFLFTDIEGSTRLWDERPDDMRAALGEHDEILRSAIAANDGVVFATGGDGFAAAFHRVADAVSAATQAQSRFGAHPFLKVRMGIHTGEAQERDRDYFGPVVNRAARIMSAGHGGQLLLSGATAAVLDSAALVDLGEHSLAGLSAAVRVFQLGSGVFPALRSADAVATNLRGERTEFVGRDRALAELERLTETNRVITLTGVGGVGKTRLAIQLAAQLLGEYRDGVWLVELAPLLDDALVVPQLLSAIGAPSRVGDDPLSEVCRLLAHKRVLLVFDNCEHVLDAVALAVDRIVDHAPRVTVVTTSREPLGIAGERVFRVPSLPIEAADGTAGEAVELFVRRAAQVRRGFALDAGTRGAIEQICRRLDGIPLAIELAAARVNVLPVDQIATRLDERFRLLNRGGRTAVARQQTLQGAIDWSYELLTEAERALFDAVSVFAGDFELTAVCSVGGLDEFEALDTVQQLVDKSMIEANADAGSYRLLETLRQYGWDRLIQHGQLAEARGRHAAHYASLVDSQAALLQSPGRQVDALDRLDRDYDNLRAALAYLIESEQADAAARMVRRMLTLFNIRHPREGLDWFRRVIAIAGALPPSSLARLLADASFAALNIGDPRSVLDYARAAVDVGGAVAPSTALTQLALWHVWNSDSELAVSFSSQAIDVARDDTMVLLATLQLLAGLGGLGDDSAVEQRVPVLIALARRLDSPTLVAVSCSNAAGALFLVGKASEAAALYDEALALADAGGPQTAVAVRCHAAVVSNDPRLVVEWTRTALVVARDHLSGIHHAFPLVAAAKATLALGRTRDATYLVGAFRGLNETAGLRGSVFENRAIDQIVASLERILRPEELAVHLEEGGRLSGEAAIHLAIAAVGDAADDR